MWVLVAEGSGGNPSRDFFLFAGLHEIGRSQTKPEGSTANGWISFPTLDKSISRNHAVVTVKKIKDVTDLNQVPEITIRDRSKYGVSIDDVDDKFCRSQASGTQSERKIRKDEDIPLRQGCSITIGVNSSRLRLEQREVKVSHSLLDKATARKVNECCAKLGAHVVSQWQENAMYLVMNELQMTPKMLLALIDQRDIVTPQFLSACLDRPTLSDPFPRPGAFVEELPPEWEQGPLLDNGSWTWRNRNTLEIVHQRPPPARRYLFAPPPAHNLPGEYLCHLQPDGAGGSNPVHKPRRQQLFQGMLFVFLCEQAAASQLVKLNQQIIEHAKGRVAYHKPATVLASNRDAASCFVVLKEEYEPGSAESEAALKLLASGARGVTQAQLYQAIIEAEVSSVAEAALDARWAEAVAAVPPPPPAAAAAAAAGGGGAGGGRRHRVQGEGEGEGEGESGRDDATAPTQPRGRTAGAHGVAEGKAEATAGGRKRGAAGGVGEELDVGKSPPTQAKRRKGEGGHEGAAREAAVQARQAGEQAGRGAPAQHHHRAPAVGHGTQREGRFWAADAQQPERADGGKQATSEGGRGPLREITMELGDAEENPRIEEDAGGDWVCVERSSDGPQRIVGPESMEPLPGYVPVADGAANVKRFRRTRPFQPRQAFVECSRVWPEPQERQHRRNRAEDALEDDEEDEMAVGSRRRQRARGRG